MNGTIITAIKQQHILSLTYDGIPREVEPHAYGVSKKGNELLRCYQVSGGHKSARPNDWDLLSVSRIEALANTGATFSGPRPDYKRGDKAMATIYQEL
jgi:hypothetical protein